MKKHIVFLAALCLLFSCSKNENLPSSPSPESVQEEVNSLFEKHHFLKEPDIPEGSSAQTIELKVKDLKELDQLLGKIDAIRVSEKQLDSLKTEHLKAFNAQYGKDLRSESQRQLVTNFVDESYTVLIDLKSPGIFTTYDPTFFHATTRVIFSIGKDQFNNYIYRWRPDLGYSYPGGEQRWIISGLIPGSAEVDNDVYMNQIGEGIRVAAMEKIWTYKIKTDITVYGQTYTVGYVLRLTSYFNLGEWTYSEALVHIQ